MPGKKGILFVIPSLAGGGAERALVLLLQHLDRSPDHDSAACLVKDGEIIGAAQEERKLHQIPLLCISVSQTGARPGRRKCNFIALAVDSQMSLKRRGT